MYHPSGGRKDRCRPVACPFCALDKGEAEYLLRAALHIWCKEDPRLVDWIEIAVPESGRLFDYAKAHRVRRCTTDNLERINRKLRRRTRIASIFPNPDARLSVYL